MFQLRRLLQDACCCVYRVPSHVTQHHTCSGYGSRRNTRVIIECVNLSLFFHVCCCSRRITTQIRCCNRMANIVLHEFHQLYHADCAVRLPVTARRNQCVYCSQSAVPSQHHANSVAAPAYQLKMKVWSLSAHFSPSVT